MGKATFHSQADIVINYANNFADNVGRVKNLVFYYRKLEETFPRSQNVISTTDDILRACVILIHVSIKDFIRHLTTLRKSELGKAQKLDTLTINHIKELKKRLEKLNLVSDDIIAICDKMESLFDRRQRIAHHGDRNFVNSPRKSHYDDSLYEPISVEFVENHLEIAETFFRLVDERDFEVNE